MPYPLNYNIETIIAQAINEDLGSGDLSAELIAENKTVQAKVITREPMILCGTEFATRVFQYFDSKIKIDWSAKDGASLKTEDKLCDIKGNFRAILTAERTALNFLQLLSATATITHKYSQAIKHTNAKILDTRKTIPGLRAAQKYAVLCGGGQNHRHGLYDAIMLKENHLQAFDSLSEAVNQANQIAASKPIILEVESLGQLKEAIGLPITRILLDNFNISDTKQAVELNHGRHPLEASGNITLDNIVEVAETGVDYISLGCLTKNIAAIDLSLNILEKYQ